MDYLSGNFMLNGENSTEISYYISKRTFVVQRRFFMPVIKSLCRDNVTYVREASLNQILF